MKNLGIVRINTDSTERSRSNLLHKLLVIIGKRESTVLLLDSRDGIVG